MREEIPVHLAHRLLNNGPVVLVTAAAKGREDVSTVAWAMPVSYNPPLVAIAVHPSRFIHELIKRSEEFVINIPSYDIAKQVAHCGDISGRDTDKFREAGFTLTSAKTVGAPLIEQCIGHLECGLIATLEPGDHTIFVGLVSAAWAKKEAFQDVWKLEGLETKPLHYLGGDYYAVLEKKLNIMKEANHPKEEIESERRS